MQDSDDKLCIIPPATRVNVKNTTNSSKLGLPKTCTNVSKNVSYHMCYATFSRVVIKFWGV